MNKIVKKTIDTLEYLLINIKKMDQQDSIVKETTELIQNTLDVLNISNNNPQILIDAYDAVEKIIYDLVELDSKNAGLIFDKILKHNLRQNKYGNRSYIEYEKLIENGYTSEEISTLINNYYINPNSLSDQEIFLLDNLVKEGKMQFENFQILYDRLGIILSKSNRTEKDYCEIKDILSKLNVPERLINDYISFIKEKDNNKKTEIVPIPIKKPKEKEEVVFPSKKELKARLNELYHPEILQDKYFDYKDIDEILYLVKGLNLPDERVRYVLNDLHRCAIKNRNYYKYLYDKAVFMEVHEDIVQDIFDLEEMISEDGTTPDINNLLLSLYNKLEYIMLIDFKYEKTRQNNELEKHKQKKLN